MKPAIQIIKNLEGFISKNSTVILTGIAVAGVITTAILAVKATTKAMIDIEEELDRRWAEIDNEKQNMNINDMPDLKTLEIIRITWKRYIPATIVGVTTVTCIIGANTVNQKRNAALAGALGFAVAEAKEYRGKVVEMFGKDKESKVREDIHVDHIRKNPPKTSEIVFTEKGNVLFYDPTSSRYFRSDVEKIRKIINDLNHAILYKEVFLTLNEFYYSIGLHETSLGDIMGWDVENGLIEIDYTQTKLSEDGEPCIILSYEINPRYLK